MRKWSFEDGGFLALLLAITLAFAFLVAPFFGSIMWGVIVAIVFRPVYVRLQSLLGGRRNVPAALCILLILALVILPAFLLAMSLFQQAADVYGQLQSGHIDLAEMFDHVRRSMPNWVDDLLDSAGWRDVATTRKMIGEGLSSLLQGIAGQAIGVGQGALQLLAALGIMLYLTFFLIRDGEAIGHGIRSVLPLREEVRDELIAHFIVVVRATLKGTLVVAALQGFAGGVIFWMLGIEAPVLWGLLMGLFSMFPAIGTGIVWVPVATYLLATGSTTEGLILIFCGLFVIGLIDNLLRPVLVGHDAKMPEYVVLISTVAGLSMLGLNGIVIGPMIAALFIAVWQIASTQRPWESGADDGGAV